MDIKLIVNPNKEWAKEAAKKIREMLRGENFVDEGEDITIVIGGDGTIFYNKDKLNGIVIAIGSSTSKRCHITYEELDELKEMLIAPSYIELPLLDVKASHTYKALNDVVIHTSNHSTLSLKAEIGGERISSKGDGVILSTPFGSSAYNLSAGGSLLSLGLEALSLSWICSIERLPSLVFPPLPVAIEVEGKADLIVDGLTVEKNVKRVEIRKSEKRIKYYFKEGIF